ncbi:MAG: acyl carrier protein phosphodiesterase [Spirochaetales bacterium]|nr:acyl carrier protein phosphodiesterase [Spirochaetales bacterium]
MNYLAHAYFSPPDPLLLIGNLSCDLIRPDEKEGLDEGLILGMELHQKIDRFTDSRKGFMEIRDILNRSRLPYAGVLTDIILDHCLASQWSSYSDLPLEEFAANVYGLLEKSIRENMIPVRFGRMARHLVDEDWFVSYRSREGLLTALDRLNYRSSRTISSKEVIRVFDQHQKHISESFSVLMKEMLPRFPHSP